MNLEGILCKRADAPYRPGRGRDWLKLKCQGREEFVVLGWTPPAGSAARLRRAASRLLRSARARLHYAGGVGSGFDAQELATLRKRLDALAAAMPKLLVSDEPIDAAIHWVRPELVAEIQYAAWSGSGRLRHSVFLGLREDKPAREVVREIADPQWRARRSPTRARAPSRAARIVTARAPAKRAVTVGGRSAITHPDRPLWPGITKQDLAEYWQHVARRRCPSWRAARSPSCAVPRALTANISSRSTAMAFPAAADPRGQGGGRAVSRDRRCRRPGRVAQMSAIELHCWGATEADPAHPDRVVFDLDPGEGVAFPTLLQRRRTFATGCNASA